MPEGRKTGPKEASARHGLLEPIVESVNTGKAPSVARERGIAISEVIHDRNGEYQSLVRLTVTTENRTRSFAGTLFGGDKPRLVEINGVGLEAELGAHMLDTVHADRPGFIGRLGTTLGDAGVNIATFHLGRAEAGDLTACQRPGHTR